MERSFKVSRAWLSGGVSFLYKLFYPWNLSCGRLGGPMLLEGIKYKPSILQLVDSMSEMSWLIP